MIMCTVQVPFSTVPSTAFALYNYTVLHLHDYGAGTGRYCTPLVPKTIQYSTQHSILNFTCITDVQVPGDTDSAGAKDPGEGVPAGPAGGLGRQQYRLPAHGGLLKDDQKQRVSHLKISRPYPKSRPSY